MIFVSKSNKLKLINNHSSSELCLAVNREVKITTLSYQACDKYITDYII